MSTQISPEDYAARDRVLAVGDALERSAAFEFFVPGRPVAKQRARTVTRGKGGVSLPFARTYTPAATMHYEAWVRSCAIEAFGVGRAPLDVPLEVEIRAHLLPPASWSAKRLAETFRGDVRPTKKPDLDNVVKGILDACNRLIWRDDSLLVSLIASKVYRDVPGITVLVRRASGRCAP